MKSFSTLLLLPVLVAASDPRNDDYTTPSRQTSTPTGASTSSTAQHISYMTPAPTTEDMPPFEFEQLPMALRQFIMGMSPKHNLHERQQAAGGGGGAAGGGVAAGGGAPVSATPTQVPSVTVYDIGEGPKTYTQTFKSPPDQWSSPAAGSVGLGTIAGSENLGKVKTYSNPAPAPTPARVVGAILAGGVGAAMVL